MAASASAKRQDSTTELINRFLASRPGFGPKYWTEAQPTDIVAFLCWLDACGKGRTPVHARHCAAVGTPGLIDCSTQQGKRTYRYPHDSLRTNYTSKLAMAFDNELGTNSDWSDAVRVGNPVRSNLVAQYTMFTRDEQKKAGVRVKQAPIILHIHLLELITPLRSALQCTRDAKEQVLLARDIALFTVAFSTTKRGNELTRTLIQRILRLPNHSGFMFNFQWGKALRGGADHLLTVPYDELYPATCPVRAVEQRVKVGTSMGWNMTRGYLFPQIDTSTTTPTRGSTPMPAAQMTATLRQRGMDAGIKCPFSMHSFRSGGAVSRALAGDYLKKIMQKAFWKRPSTAWRYMRLMEVVDPG
ncbi:unnamed protein product, partial [Sphacelaria rigidula]